MNKETLESLGLSTDDVLNRLIDRLTVELFTDEEGFASKFRDKLEVGVRKRIDERIDAAMQTHILPNITEMVDGICLQETNKWGEPRGEKLTFIEYLVQRADAYVWEEVDYQGRTKAERGPYDFKSHRNADSTHDSPAHPPLFHRIECQRAVRTERE